MQQGNPVAVNYDRVRAVLSLQGRTVTALARELTVTPYHLIAVLKGERPSARLLDRVRQSIGADGWAFATGQADTLCAPTAA